MSDAFRPSHGLAECFEMANDETYTRSHGFLSNRAYRFLAQNGLIKVVSEYVKARFGLSKFQYIGCGDNVIVVRYAEFQVLRVRAPAIRSQANTQRVIESPLICPIWREIEFQGARLNFVPYVPSLAKAVLNGGISLQIAQEYIFALLRAGFESNPPLWFYDHKNHSYKFEQIGLIPEGTPIIIDQGAVILEAGAPQERFSQLSADKAQVFGRIVPPIPSWDGSWFDANGIPKIESLPKPCEQVMS